MYVCSNNNKNERITEETYYLSHKVSQVIFGIKRYYGRSFGVPQSDNNHFGKLLGIPI